MNFSTVISAFFGAILLGIGLGFLTSYPIMLLWNGCAVPAITGLHEITWLQSWGICALSAGGASAYCR